MKSRPEILPLRNLRKNTFNQKNSFADARTTKYVFDPKGADVIEATELTGEYPRALRKLSLIKARHGISHTLQRNLVPDFSVLELADEIRLNTIFAKTFSEDDAYVNYNAREMVALFGTPEQIKINPVPLIHEFARTINTSANAKLLRAIKDDKIKIALKQMKKEIRIELRKLKHDILYVNADDMTAMAHEHTVLTIADIINQFGTDNKPKKKGQQSKPREGKVENQQWCKLAPAFPKLEITHNGRMNRRRRPNEMGKTPKYLSRLLTDPSRRIFAKKSKSLGGVVVIDCSGSMGLSQKDIENLIKSASGSTIWAYSSSCHRQDLENTWLVAHQGKRVRDIPNFHGGNGVDLPAIAYATRYRKNKNDTMIWISDGHVTGNAEVSEDKLRRATALFIKKFNIHHTETIAEAMQILSDAQKGKHKKRKTSYWEKIVLSRKW